MENNKKGPLPERIKKEFGYEHANIITKIFYPKDKPIFKVVEAEVKDSSGKSKKCWFGLDSKDNIYLGKCEKTE